MSCNTLIICRTPFQAVMLKRIIELEEIKEYDILYLTQNNSDEDKNYFSELKSGSRTSQYIYVVPKRYDILNHIKMYFDIQPAMKRKIYKRVVLASFDNLAVRRIAMLNEQAEIISFDDGTGNINKKSIYWSNEQNFREKIYSLGIGMSDRQRFISRIRKHYSAYLDFENVIPSQYVRYINPFDLHRNIDSKSKGPTFFIGQPYKLTSEKIEALVGKINEYSVDYYVKHPRESRPIVTDIPLLEKNGKIAEEAIFEASQGGKPRIIGGFSSVLLNIPHDQAEKIMFLVKDDIAAKHYSELAAQAGCKVVIF